jgi:hypothetical protein
VLLVHSELLTLAAAARHWQAWRATVHPSALRCQRLALLAGVRACLLQESLVLGRWYHEEVRASLVQQVELDEEKPVEQ